MSEQFEYRGYQVAFEVNEHAKDGHPEWSATVYLRTSEDAPVESFSVSPPDGDPTEARERAIRVAKSAVDKKLIAAN